MVRVDTNLLEKITSTYVKQMSISIVVSSYVNLTFLLNCNSPEWHILDRGERNGFRPFQIFPLTFLSKNLVIGMEYAHFL